MCMLQFFFTDCRLLHLALLALNMLAMRSLSALSGGSRSVFSKKDNARAVIIVASQVLLALFLMSEVSSHETL